MKNYSLSVVSFLSVAFLWVFSLRAEESCSLTNAPPSQAANVKTNCAVKICQNTNSNSVFQIDDGHIKTFRKQRFTQGLDYLFFFPFYGIENGIISIAKSNEHSLQFLNNLVLAVPMCTTDYLICGILKTFTLGAFWNDNLIFDFSGMRQRF